MSSGHGFTIINILNVIFFIFEIKNVINEEKHINNIC